VSIDLKMAEVQAKVQRLDRSEATITPKGGGRGYSYRYISEASMWEFLQPLLAEAKIATYHTTDLIGTDGNMVRVKVRVVFVDAEDGSEAETSMIAQAADQGDKAIAKAVTGATRYLYWKQFRFPADDPEDEAGTSTAHVTADEAASERLLAELREAAREKRMVGSVAAAIEAHKADTGLLVPHPEFLTGLLERVRAASPPEAAETPPNGSPAAAGASASADPLAGLDAAQPVEKPFAMTAAQREALMAELGQLKAIRPDVHWLTKIAARCQEWYGEADMERLAEDQVTDLITRLTTVAAKLKEAADAPA
jgi:hypothetical protein